MFIFKHDFGVFSVNLTKTYFACSPCRNNSVACFMVSIYVNRFTMCKILETRNIFEVILINIYFRYQHNFYKIFKIYIGISHCHIRYGLIVWIMILPLKVELYTITRFWSKWLFSNQNIVQNNLKKTPLTMKLFFQNLQSWSSEKCR